MKPTETILPPEYLIWKSKERERKRLLWKRKKQDEAKRIARMVSDFIQAEFNLNKKR